MMRVTAVLAAVSICVVLGCNKGNESSGSKDISNPAAGSSSPVSPVIYEDNHVPDISHSTRVDGLTIKHLGIGAETVDVFNPNVKGVSTRQRGALVAARCIPRIKKDSVNHFADSPWPILLTSNSKVILHRDTNYLFGDGTNASSADPYVLMTCSGRHNKADEEARLTSSDSTVKVQVKELRVGDQTMEVLDPNLKSVTRQQPGLLTFVMCSPKLTDSNIKDAARAVADAAPPITLAKGSQIALARDTSYRFGDGSNASKMAPEVIITCDLNEDL